MKKIINFIKSLFTPQVEKQDIEWAKEIDFIRNQQVQETIEKINNKYPKMKKVKEYGGKEVYASKSAMKKHEKKETKKVEKKEQPKKKK